MTHNGGAPSGASFLLALPVSRTSLAWWCGTVRTSRANSPLRRRALRAHRLHSDFARGTIFTLSLRFGLDGLRSRSVPSRPKPCGETKNFFRAPACCRALRPAFTLDVPPVEPGVDASSRIHSNRCVCCLHAEESGCLASGNIVPSLRLLLATVVAPFYFSSLLPAAFRSGAIGLRCGAVRSAFRTAGREAARFSRGICIQRYGCGKLKKEFAAPLILRFNERRNSRIVRVDKVCVCRTAQPPAARPQTPLQGGSAPVDPRDDRSERTR